MELGYWRVRAYPLSPTLDQLFVSDLMETIPSWRANIAISSETTSTSFQGEYPGNLIQAKKGTLFSFGPMVLAQTGLTTKFLLINLRAKPGNEPCRIKFGLLGQDKILKEAIVFQNSLHLEFYKAVKLKSISLENTASSGAEGSGDAL